MDDRINEIRATVNKLISLLTEEIYAQRTEIEQLKRTVAALDTRCGDSRFVNEIPANESKVSINDDTSANYQKESIADKAFKSTRAWMVDIPGEKVDSMMNAIPLNDRLYFINTLFGEDEDQYYLTIERIDEMSSFEEVVRDMREAFPEWDEFSDDVYRFYMFIRRKFKK